MPVGKRLRVLVVDDEADMVDTLAFLLSAWGHEVRKAATGDEALQAADTMGPDLILMDIAMPGANGWEVMRQLRGRPENRDTLCVALTGFGQENDKRRSKEAGFDFHLVKPVGFTGLNLVPGEAAGGRPKTVGNH